MTELVTCNGRPVLELRLTRPLIGRWVAALELDSDDAVTGLVEIKQGSVRYAGTVVRSGALAGSCRAEVVGGRAGLSRDVLARSYERVAARVVVDELLRGVGETLDAASTAATLGRSLTYWTRAAGQAATALSALVVDALGARWRVLETGAVWVGIETWRPVADGYDALEMDRDDGAGTVLLAPEDISLAPGVTYAGRRVGRVEHHFSRSEPLRTTFWAEAA